VKADKITVPEKLLLAALEARKKGRTFSAEDLVVKAWEMYPDTFGLSGYSDKYPDSNRVFTKIMGTKGMRGKGWLRKVGEKQYQVTFKALSDGEIILNAGLDDKKPESGFLRAELNRVMATAIDRLVSSSASQKWLVGEEEFTFHDACSFWDISSRSNANTLNVRLEEVTVLLGWAVKMVDRLSDLEGLKLPRRNVAKKEVLGIVQLHGAMQKQFKEELDILRRRTDERSEKKRR